MHRSRMQRCSVFRSLVDGSSVPAVSKLSLASDTRYRAMWPPSDSTADFLSTQPFLPSRSTARRIEQPFLPLCHLRIIPTFSQTPSQAPRSETPDSILPDLPPFSTLFHRFPPLSTVLDGASPRPFFFPGINSVLSRKAIVAEVSRHGQLPN